MRELHLYRSSVSQAKMENLMLCGIGKSPLLAVTPQQGSAWLGFSSQSTKEQDSLPAATSTSSDASLQSLTSLLTQCLHEFPDF